MEIVGNAPNRGSLRIDPEHVASVDAACARYHLAEDKAAFRANDPIGGAYWFPNRYGEWLAIATLLAGIDLRGRDVLDIGAGQGFDACRLALLGAQVTALEFNPIVAEAGAQGMPDLRWIGGFAHALPFRDASFDHVFINAALHHMRDLPVTIAEALRVLRPGGSLITTSDPFRPDNAGQELEFEIFDRHEAVLLGINEQIPVASGFLGTLERNRDILEPEIFTQILYGGVSGTDPALEEWARWDLDRDAAMLKGRSGSIAMRVRLKAPWPHPRALQRDGVLAPATFVAWLEDPPRAVAELARIIPGDLLDTPFPGTPTKFDLINGWRVAQTDAESRTGHRRARLFRRRGKAKALRFEISSAVPARFTFCVNAAPVGAAEVGAEWKRVVIDVTSVPPGEPFVVEFRREGEAADFDAGCFRVRPPQPGPLARLAALLRRPFGYG